MMAQEGFPAKARENTKVPKPPIQTTNQGLPETHIIFGLEKRPGVVFVKPGPVDCRTDAETALPSWGQAERFQL